MRLTASLGVSANSRSVCDIFLRPAKRKTEIAAFRIGVHDVWNVSGSCVWSVFAEDDISYPMKFIFYRPVVSAKFEQVFCGSLLRRQTCDAILRLVCDFCGLDVVSLDRVFVDLCKSWPVSLRCQEGATSQGLSGDKSMCGSLSVCSSRCASAWMCRFSNRRASTSGGSVSERGLNRSRIS